MRIRRFGACGVTLVVLGAVGAGVAWRSPVRAQGAAPLPAYSAARAFTYLEQLAGRIGERPAGSEAEGRAVDYIAGQFKSWGLEPQVQTFPVPVWEQKAARLWAEGDRVPDILRIMSLTANNMLLLSLALMFTSIVRSPSATRLTTSAA